MDKDDTEEQGVDQIQVPESGKRRPKMSLEDATEAVILNDKNLGNISVPTTPNGNRNYQLYISSIMRSALQKILKTAKDDDFENMTPQQFKQLAEAMKIVGDMAREAFQNPEDPSNNMPKESSPMTGVLGKLLGNVEKLANSETTTEEATEALKEIDLISENLDEEEQENVEEED